MFTVQYHRIDDEPNVWSDAVRYPMVKSEAVYLASHMVRRFCIAETRVVEFRCCRYSDCDCDLIAVECELV